jgi:hypothetical protein
MANAEVPDDLKAELDSVDQFMSLSRGATPETTTRDSFLYNYDKSKSTSSFWSDAPGAFRYKQYKLMHTYNSPSAAKWYVSHYVPLQSSANVDTTLDSC